MNKPASSQHILLPSSIRPSLRFYGIFIAASFLIFPIHELGHYLTYRLLGIHLHMTLNTASPHLQSLRRPIAEIAGPVVSLLVAIAAYILSRRIVAPWPAAIALAACFSRIDVYLLVLISTIITGSSLSMGNDEPIAAHLWGLPGLSLVLLFAIPFTLIIVAIMRRFTSRKALHVLLFAVIFFAIGILVANVLDPMFFPKH